MARSTRSAVATDVLKRAASVFISTAKVGVSTNTMYLSKKVDLIRISGDIISPALNFEAGRGGSYLITEFMVLDAAGNTIALTPKGGSGLAGLVSQPLNIPFKIKAETTNRMNIEVIVVGNLSASAFGFSIFGIVQVNTSSFLLNAFTYNTTSKLLNLATATTTILNVTTSKSYGAISMLASTTSIAYPATANVNDVIRITVSKAGYQTITVTKTLAYLKTTLTAAEGPLGVILSTPGTPTTGAPTFRGGACHVLHLDAADPKSYSGTGTKLIDLSGDGHYGAIHGATYVSTTTGKYFSFDGTDDYIETTKKGHPRRWTVSVWFRPKTRAAAANWASTVYENSDSHFNKGYLLFLFRNERILARHRNTDGETIEIGPRKYNIDQWNHVVWSLDGNAGGNVHFLLNGKVTSKTSPDQGNALLIAPILIGVEEGRGTGSTPVKGNYFLGDIAKFEMYDGAMTDPCRATCCI